MPGVRMRFLPEDSAELIVANEVEGVAIKKVLMAREVPAPRPPLDQSAPDEFVRRDGENTK
jgi:hypothetical protein